MLSYSVRISFSDRRARGTRDPLATIADSADPVRKLTSGLLPQILHERLRSPLVVLAYEEAGSILKRRIDLMMRQPCLGEQVERHGMPYMDELVDRAGEKPS